MTQVDASRTLIEAKQLTKSYQSRHHQPGFSGFLNGLFRPEYVTHVGLKPLDLKLERGEILGVLGPNGAGKSTLIKLLTGIQTPTEGGLSVVGYQPSERATSYLKLIGVVFGHKSSLWWDLPVRMSFDSIRQIYGLDEARYEERLKELAPPLGITEAILNRPARVLSLGERVKCEVLGALLHEPKLLFLDEPTVGLDITSRTELRALLKAYAAEKGIGIILTSHDVGDIETCCTRVLLVSQGTLMFDGRIDALKAAFSDVVRLRINANAEPFEASDLAEVRTRLSGYLNPDAEVRFESEVIEVTLSKEHSRKAIGAIVEMDKNVSIEVRSPDLEEVLLYHFRSFPNARLA